MQAQKEAPANMQCKDKFLLQSAKAPDGATEKDITAEMFNKDSRNVVEERKLRVIYVSPPQPPSPVAEESEEGSSPRGSVSHNGNANGSETAARAFADRLDPQEKSAEVLGNDYLSTLIQFVDPSELPTFLGGNCICSDSGGCLMSDKGPWNDSDITEILEAIYTTEDSDNMENSFATEDADPTQMRRKARSGDGNSTQDDRMVSEKILALEVAVEDTKTKIEILEDALENMKEVLNGLTFHIGELRL